MKLTRTERWMLSNQYRILEKLYPEEADSLAETREALEHGYELHYGWSTEHIYDGDVIMTEAECEEVLDILNMFSKLQDAYERLTDKSGIDSLRIEFEGFDGNHETKQMAYARYFCRSDGGRYTELKTRDNFNSHTRSLDRYRRQLAEWREIADEFNPTREDIARVAAAAVHPENR